MGRRSPQFLFSLPSRLQPDPPGTEVEVGGKAPRGARFKFHLDRPVKDFDSARNRLPCAQQSRLLALPAGVEHYAGIVKEKRPDVA